MAQLSLDLGAHLGWCVRKNEGGFISGCINMTKKKGESKYAKLQKLQDFLDETHTVYSIDKIFYERVDFGMHTYATQAHGAYKGVVHQFAENNGIDIEGIAVATIKKSLTGRGNASKQGMIYYAEKYIGKEITDDNEADAIGVMHAGRRGKK